MAEMRDRLETLREVMSLREIASLIERTARWVAPETFKPVLLWHTGSPDIYIPVAYRIFLRFSRMVFAHISAIPQSRASL